MEYNNLKLFCCFALFAVSCARGARDTDNELPTKVEYLDVGIHIVRDIGFFSNETRGISLQYINGEATLNWETNLLNEIGHDYMVHLVVNKRHGENCWRKVYDSGLMSFCRNIPQEVASYIDIIGLYAAEPSVISCPFQPGTYKLKDFQVDTSRLKNIERGHLAIDYDFEIKGQRIIRLTAEVIVS